MKDNILWLVTMTAWMISTSVFIGASTKRGRQVAMWISFVSAAAFAGAAFGWTLMNCVLGWLVGMLLILLLAFVASRLQKLPPAQHHHHSR